MLEPCGVRGACLLEGVRASTSRTTGIDTIFYNFHKTQRPSSGPA